MTGRTRALLRLFAVQGAWSYDRMLGIGMGHAAVPLLAPLETQSAERHAEATARSAEFFNANPNLAGLALGALARAELDGRPPEQITRLRAALCSPLGALGDQLFWAGVVPALSGIALAAAVLGAGWWAAVGLVAAYTGARVWVLRWSLDSGLAAGAAVGQLLARSWVTRAIAPIGATAAFAVGSGVSLVAGWLAAGGGRDLAAMVLIALVGIGIGRYLTPALTALRFGLLAAALALLLRWTAA